MDMRGSSAPGARRGAVIPGPDDEALSKALAEAQELVTRFSTEHAGSTLRPVATARLALGGDEQPLFVFELLVDLGDDLDANEYPIDEISRLQDELRRRVEETTVDDWDWIVSAGTKAGAAARAKE